MSSRGQTTNDDRFEPSSKSNKKAEKAKANSSSSNARRPAQSHNASSRGHNSISQSSITSGQTLSSTISLNEIIALAVRTVSHIESSIGAQTYSTTMFNSSGGPDVLTGAQMMLVFCNEMLEILIKDEAETYTASGVQGKELLIEILEPSDKLYAASLYWMIDRTGMRKKSNMKKEEILTGEPMSNSCVARMVLLRKLVSKNAPKGEYGGRPPVWYE